MPENVVKCCVRYGLYRAMVINYQYGIVQFGWGEQTSVTSNTYKHRCHANGARRKWARKQDQSVAKRGQVAFVQFCNRCMMLRIDVCIWQAAGNHLGQSILTTRENLQRFTRKLAKGKNERTIISCSSVCYKVLRKL